MEAKKVALKSEIVDKIKSDPILYGAVASALGVAPLSLPRILAKENNDKLTQFSVLSAIKMHLGNLKDSDLLEEMQQDETKSTAA